MSNKIKSKDLSYDSSLPPFLQRLHNQNAGGDADRHERQIARPRKARDPNDDDGPTVVDETGETLTKEQVEDLTGASTKLTDHDSADVSGSGEGAGESETIDGAPNSKISSEVPSKYTESGITDGTAQKKRKIAKVIGEDAGPAAQPPEGQSTPKKPAKKMKKKTQVKIMYDDD